MTISNIIKGQNFPTDAARWNRVFAATRKIEGRSSDNTSEPSQPSAGIEIANTSNDPIEAFTLVAIGGVVDDGTDDGYAESFVFEAATIDVQTSQQYAVTQERLEPGEVGEAIVSDLTTARISGTEKAYAKPTAAGLEFTDDVTKYKVLHKKTGSDLCKVFIGADSAGGAQRVIVWAKVTADVRPDSSGPMPMEIVEVISGPSTLELQNITVENPVLSDNINQSFIFSLLNGFRVRCELIETSNGSKWLPDLAGFAHHAPIGGGGP